MKSIVSFLLLVVVVALANIRQSVGFTLPSLRLVKTEALGTGIASSTSLRFGPFSAPKDDGSPGDYVCKDCGYVFTKGPKAWAALPEDYSCPPCGAPKRRFKKVPKGSASGKVEVKKSWFG
mmetsp:Transcript_39597/g.114572  ORF Transcript_39597/g.114572 Transcript_39597/m.114572 type:complete len:121 (-) Transcript_39597:223-585(-)